MKTPILITTAALALALTGCEKSSRSANTNANDTSADYTASTTGNASADMNSAMNRASNDMRSAANSAGNALSNVASNVATSARIAEWRLTANDLRADLDNKREIVRTKDSSAGAPTGSNDASVLKSMVEGRLQADSSISALKLDVDAEKNGEVELSGKAQTADQVGRAIALALDTEGVNKVTSKIKLDR